MLLETLQNRRSIRAFENHPVEPEKLERILQAALLSPSSKGIRPWSFILVDDPKLLQALAASKPHGSDFISSAAFAIVVCADIEAAAAWIEDCSIAAIDIQLAIEEEELGSCWVQIRERQTPDGSSASEYIKHTLEIPDNYEIDAVIAAGYPAEQKAPHSLESLQWNKVFRNKYGSKYLH
ncbi:MAG: nitroreductase family protein [Spirochaetota bacterium]